MLKGEEMFAKVLFFILLSMSITFQLYDNFGRITIKRELIDTNIDDKQDTLNEKHIKLVEKYNPDDAVEIVMAITKWSEEYNIDPIFVSTIIETESGFKSNVRHKHSSVVGLGGIHKKIWSKILKGYGLTEIDTIDSQVRAVFIVITHISKTYKTNDYSEILHYYKGRGYDKHLRVSGKELADRTYRKYKQNLRML